MQQATAWLWLACPTLCLCNFDQFCGNREDDNFAEESVVISESYNSFQHPYHDLGLTTTVLNTIGVRVVGVSQVAMVATLSIWHLMVWNETRFGHLQPTNISQPISSHLRKQIWQPEVQYESVIHVHNSIITDDVVFLSRNKMQTFEMTSRHTVDILCPMSLENYPFDTQMCDFYIIPTYYKEDKLKMTWGKLSISKKQQATLPEYNVTIKILSSIEMSNHGYSMLALQLVLKRNYVGHVYATFVPCIIFVLISWLSLFLPHQMIQPRVTLGITTVLTIVTLSVNSRSSLPPMAELRAVDEWFLMCLLIVFICLSETVIVSALAAAPKLVFMKIEDKEKLCGRIDRVSQIVLIISFPIYAVIFCVRHISLS
ncbi:Uncharacterised protein g10195 [Pycnogonum litorale]